MTADHVSCPNCGHGFEGLRKSTRMFDCPSCGTTLFREADALAPIGNSGEMHAYPMLFGLGDTVLAEGQRYGVVGHARYDYGRGTWDEFHVENERGQGAWISVDEGDIAIQHPLGGGSGPQVASRPPVGAVLNWRGARLVVTEADRATCIAVRGEFPERIAVGDTHDFVNVAGPSGQILSGEFWEGGQAWHEGSWLDPFTLRVERRDGSRVGGRAQ